MINENTVCILTSGKGTRMGPLGLKLAKALHPINGKAIISHIIEKFPSNTSFVISIGYLGHQVENYLTLAHPNIKFTFVKIDNFDGPGSGPGYSLFCCKNHLDKPFYFVSCDTLWSDNVDWNIKRNWFGVSKIVETESKNYCNFKIKNDLIIEIIDKKKVKPKNHVSFIGLCHIYDYEIFWEALKNKAQIKDEHQISNGILGLISQKKVKVLHLDWTDIGDEEKYKQVLHQYENYDFSKSDESLYIINNKVIKFFHDEDIVKKRVSKASLNHKIFPKINFKHGQFYSYSFLEGQTLYEYNNIDIFTKLLKWLDHNLWKPYPVNKTKMDDACKEFYKNKTLKRLDSFMNKYPKFDESKKVNGKQIAKLNDIFINFPWDSIIAGVPVFMHGDLQFDNIIFNKKTGSFKLLDWRQDFAGNINFGDLNYDLAKLYGGIILNYDLIKLNLFKYEETENNIYFDFAQRYHYKHFIKIFQNFILSRNLNIKKIRIIVGLIYLNMSPLHHAPFDKMLFQLGKLTLEKELNLANK